MAKTIATRCDVTRVTALPTLSVSNAACRMEEQAMTKIIIIGALALGLIGFANVQESAQTAKDISTWLVGP